MKLFLKVALFTVVMPGTFAGLLPVLIVGDRAVSSGATLARFQCSEHALGAEDHAPDALAADCVVVRRN